MQLPEMTRFDAEALTDPDTIRVQAGARPALPGHDPRW